MLGELTSASREDSGDVADVAISLAPNDPRPRWLSAMVLKRNFDPESFEMSVRRLEEAVRLAPNDYRTWTDLSRGYEQSERYAEAEATFRRAIDLAPNYVIPHWQMGNFLLRQDRVDEAKSELRLATENSSAYRNQVFALAWNYFDKDPSVIEELTTDNPASLADLAFFLAIRERGRDALRVWNRIPPEQKPRFEYLSRPMARVFQHTGYANESFLIGRDAGFIRDELPETISNAGFERLWAILKKLCSVGGSTGRKTGSRQ